MRPCGSPRCRASSTTSLQALVIGGYTRDADAEPGSRCKSDTVLATVTRELEPHVATGPTAWEGGVRALDLRVRRPPASSCSADPREREGLCRPIMPCAHRQGCRHTAVAAG